jgi:hypothetical protein
LKQAQVQIVKVLQRSTIILAEDVFDRRAAPGAPAEYRP